MPYDFDTPVDRRGTASLKWDSCAEIFGAQGLLPLWVADMDFCAPPGVLEELGRLIRHGVFGYVQDPLPASAFAPISEWTESCHGSRMREDCLRFAPGVVSSLYAAVAAFTRPGEGVIVQPPVYPPFFQAVRQTGRVIVENPLCLDNGRHEMDLEGLKRCLTPATRLLILCNPHNPGGRVWDRATLEALAEICRTAGVLVVSDEIHADIVFAPRCFTPFRAVEPASLTLYAASKTFNIPGLGASLVYSERKELRETLMGAIFATGWHQSNCFGLAGTLAAFTHGGPWLDELLPYLAANAAYAHETLARLGIDMPVPQSTYLGWMDCRPLALENLPAFFTEQAGLALNTGTDYGFGGEGFMRINLGCRRALLRTALERLERALEKR